MMWPHNLLIVLQAAYLSQIALAQVCFVECNQQILQQTGCADLDIVCRCKPANLIIAKNCILALCLPADQIEAEVSAELDCPNATSILFGSPTVTGANTSPSAAQATNTGSANFNTPVPPTPPNTSSTSDGVVVTVTVNNNPPQATTTTIGNPTSSQPTQIFGSKGDAHRQGANMVSALVGMIAVLWLALTL
ncbi:hypothetical protein CPC08DRAFT_707512 [Agrocybe pediades]|nr:hypothetical protein CPC08DRAFT_707512 [Agrocybe pediades]